MKREAKDAGTIAALMMRLRDYRLPRAQRMLERVKHGETLQDSDLQFLHRVFDEGRDIQPLVERHPEYLSLVSRMADLYSEIVSRSLENEQKQVNS